MNKSFSSAKEALVCSFRAGGTNRRHLVCGNAIRSRGCAVQNKGITLKHVNFNHVNKMEARYKALRLNMKLREVLLLRLPATFHPLPLFHLRT